MTCHAYVKGNFMEPWINHVKDVLRIFDDCFMDIVPILSSRLGVSETDAVTIAKLSVAFHDLGKTLNAYQLNCTKIHCSESNYYGHEVVGAFMLDKLISTLIDAQCIKDSGISKYRYLIILSVMMHHHAMRDLSNWWIRRVNMVNLLDKLNEWMNTLNISELRICDDCINDIASILESILGGQCSNLSKVVEDFAEELTWNKPMDLIRDLINWFMSNKDYLVYRKDQLLILGPLIVSDNEAANRDRVSKSRRSLISHELSLKCNANK